MNHAPILATVAALAAIFSLASCDAFNGLDYGANLGVDSDKTFTQDIKYDLGATVYNFSKSGTFTRETTTWNGTVFTILSGNGEQGTYTYDPSTLTLTMTVKQVWNGSGYAPVSTDKVYTWKRAMTDRAMLDAWEYNVSANSFTKADQWVEGSNSQRDTITYTFKGGAYAYRNESATVGGTTIGTPVTASGTYETYGNPVLSVGNICTYVYTEASRSAGAPQKGSICFSVATTRYAITPAGTFGRALR